MNLAFVTYETPYAPCGGVAAAMRYLPPAIQLECGDRTIVLSPFHHRIDRMRNLETECVGRISIPFEGEAIPVEIHLHKDGCEWYFLRPQDRRFFAGQRHPFDIRSGEDLLRDSLLFGSAVASSLPEIASGESWTLHLQDWEAATTALALAGIEESHRLFITLHNTYDQEVTPASLSRFGIHPEACPGTTVLSRALPLVEHPVFTVSQQFALDVSEEIWQQRIMAPHLQEALSGRLVGIDNGPFADLTVGERTLETAKMGDFSSLRRWKSTRRTRFLRSLDSLADNPSTPVWGDLIGFSREKTPWFIMAGRDDPRQKGYDVAASAARGFLEEGGNAHFLFFPIPGDEGLAGLQFLRRLSKRFPENVLVFPFLFKEGFGSAVQGATFGLMPSFYEPFGMANEFYLNGTPAVGRATGGILQQIVPTEALSSFSGAVLTRAMRARGNGWYGEEDHPTGILFRERDDIVSAEDDWREVNVAGYGLGGKTPDRVAQRERLVLFSEMVSELKRALWDAIHLYHEDSSTYHRMILEGIHHIRNRFSWKRAATTYAVFSSSPSRTHDP